MVAKRHRWNGRSMSSHDRRSTILEAMDREMVVEVMDDEMADLIRQKSPAERLEIASGLWRSARAMLTTVLTAQHPEWSEERVAAEVARRLSHGAC